MTLITVGGSNPFNGQSDPYLSLSSNIEYGDNGEGEIKNSYLLEGVLTGCSKDDLIVAQNNVVNHFDWKVDAEITEKINIAGVISATKGNRLIPTSLNFENSNYVGSLSYSLQIDVFTGFASELIEPSSINLIERTHTQTKTIDGKGCVRISTNISCAPNPNMTGCEATEAANKWVNSRLGVTQIGNVSSQSDLTLDSESITINPITSQVSYSSNSSDGCDNSIKDNALGASGKFQTAICSEIVDDNPDCPQSTKTEKIQGEIYSPSGNAGDLMSYLSTSVINGDVKDLSANYSNNSLSFSYIKIDPNAPKEPEDYVLNDQTVTINIDHDAGTSSTSVNGTISLLNPVIKTSSNILSISDKAIEGQANSVAGGSSSSSSITRNIQEGTIGYSYSYSSEDMLGQSDSQNPQVFGVLGVSSFSVSYTPSLDLYGTIQNINCDDLIVKKDGQKSRGNFSISLSAQSGSGYDFRENAQQLMNQWKNTLKGGATEFIIDNESSNLSNCDTAISMQVSANFLKGSATNKNSIISMY
tara:strand:+ start:5390 stop:6979 length:1590 start_codon:yes stop_codon:yes gene_type:complete